MRIGPYCAIIFLALSVTGCVRREGRNDDCKWPGEITRHAAGPRHLSADAEFAEDLAIRYADTHYGLRTRGYTSGANYDAQRDQCMESLFAQVAAEHNVPVALVSGALGQNRAIVDLATNLPLLVLYCLAAVVTGRWLLRRYPPVEHGWAPLVLMALFIAIAAAVGSSMLGESWAWFVEGLRVGNGHMSYRAQRLWCVRHRAIWFASAVIVFLLVVAACSKPVRTCTRQMERL